VKRMAHRDERFRGAQRRSETAAKLVDWEGAAQARPYERSRKRAYGARGRRHQLVLDPAFVANGMEDLVST